jgi:hypothetical protein
VTENENRPPDRRPRPPQLVARDQESAEEVAADGRSSADDATNSLVTAPSQEAESRDARGYSWPPFEAGNTAGLVHGAHSARTIAAKAAELEPAFRVWLAEHAKWASAPEFGPVRVNYLRSAAVVELLETDIVATVTEHGTAKVPTRRFETLLSALRNERDALTAMGLTPPTRAQMAATVASTEATLADLRADGEATAGCARFGELALIEGQDDGDEQ